MKWIGIFDKKQLLNGGSCWQWMQRHDTKIYTGETFEDYVKRVKSPMYVVVELEIDEY